MLVQLSAADDPNRRLSRLFRHEHWPPSKNRLSLSPGSFPGGWAGAGKRSIPRNHGPTMRSRSPHGDDTCRKPDAFNFRSSRSPAAAKNHMAEKPSLPRIRSQGRAYRGPAALFYTRRARTQVSQQGLPIFHTLATFRAWRSERPLRLRGRRGQSRHHAIAGYTECRNSMQTPSIPRSMERLPPAMDQVLLDRLDLMGKQPGVPQRWCG